MSNELNLRIPGPIPLPEEKLRILASQLINHRGPEYADMLDRMTLNLKACLKTKSDAYFLTASGTAAMETAIVNTLSPDDPVLCVRIGWFGDRFADICRTYGVNVTMLNYDSGEAANPDDLRAKLREKQYKAVLITHNESSTGVCNPLKELAAAIKETSDALIIVDAISSSGSIELETDAWNIDVVVSASQKGWLAPPGIAMLTFSARAWEAYEKSKLPKYYLDLGAYKTYFEKYQPPFTPAVSIMFVLEHSLETLAAEGISVNINKHTLTASKVRQGITSIGLELLPRDIQYASNTVTAVKLPDGIKGAEFIKVARDKYHVEFGGGMGETAGKIFRIGHMGWLDTNQLDSSVEIAARVIDELSK